MTLAALLAFFTELEKLGASPAVQKLALDMIAKYEGVPQEKLDAILKAAKDAPNPS